jgi:putative transposase
MGAAALDALRAALGLEANGPARPSRPAGPLRRRGSGRTHPPRARGVALPRRGLSVFVAVDHCTTECIGLHASRRGSRFEALEPIRQGVREHFGGFAQGIAHGLRLRHDHGSNYLADDFQQEVAFLGIESSPSFVREPEGNGVAERFIRTLKENLLWVRSFETIEELRQALLEFKRTYNEQWMLQKYDYRSPAQVRRDLQALDQVA